MGHSSIFYFKCTACGACGAAYGNWACVVRRRVGKGIQGACAPMAERWAGALLRRGAAGAAGGAIGDLGALGGAR